MQYLEEGTERSQDDTVLDPALPDLSVGLEPLPQRGCQCGQQTAGHPYDFYACFSERDVVWANRVRFHIERLQAALPARGQGAVSYLVRP